MNILVTGGLGFIGHNVVRLLENTEHTIIITDNKDDYGIIPKDELDYLIKERYNKIKSEYYSINIADSYAIPSLFKDYKFDIVIHLASFPRQKVVNANPLKASRIMSEGLLNLLEAAKENNTKKFVYISSSMVYGDFTDGIKEDTVCNPQGAYGIMKLSGEWLVKDYAKSCGMNYTIIRPSAVYGPLDVEDRVISKFILNAMRGEDLIVNGVDESLDFTYVDDVANGIVQAALSNNTENKTYNITAGKSVKLLDAAILVSKLINQKSTIKIQNKDQNFPSRGSLNIDAARKDFSYYPHISIEEGTQKYYEWIKSSEFWNKQLSK